MITHELIQGSPEWLAYRALHFNASDAPAMMGHGEETRNELLRRLHTGLNREFSTYVQERVIDPGHTFEAQALPLAEQLIGQRLYRVTGSEGRYSASFDGLTMAEDIAYEHKRLNAQLRAAIRQQGGNANDFLPPKYRIQMEQQCMVSGAGRVLFMASEWDADGNLMEERNCWYTPDAELRAEIIAGWDQFERDLAAYVPPEPVAPAPVGRAPIALPALRLEVNGGVTASNLPEFKLTALSVIRAVNLNLQTDQDFADAEQSVKWCADVEGRLEAAKQHALSQTKSIDELFKAIDDISAEARRVRLNLEKIVKARKEDIRSEMVMDAICKLRGYVQGLNDELVPASIPDITGSFAAVIKGKRSIATIRNALDDELAVCKIEAESKARGIRANLAAFKAQASRHDFLFPDVNHLVHKAQDDFIAVVQSRIAVHEKAEAEKARLADEAKARAPGHVMQTTTDNPPAPIVVAQVAEQKAPAEEEPATLKLGDIATRLGFTLSAQFVSDVLAVKPAKTDGRAVLYRESDWRLICQALVRRIEGVYESTERGVLAA